MGCVISCGLKLVLQLLNTVLFLAFLAVAVFGIILKSSKPIVEKLMDRLLSSDNIGDDDVKQIANFITSNADGIAIILIVVGFALAAICLIGLIASCCGCGILLKIYGLILIVLLIAQIIAVAVLFSDPNRLSGLVIKALDKALSDYNKQDSPSKAVWDVLMRTDKVCCGMDGYEDFNDQANLPKECCESNSNVVHRNKACTAEDAKTSKIPGCKSKLTDFVQKNLKPLLYASIVAICLQALLITLVWLTICL